MEEEVYKLRGKEKFPIFIGWKSYKNRILRYKREYGEPLEGLTEECMKAIGSYHVGSTLVLSIGAIVIINKGLEAIFG